jgi:hypothetical protein
MSRKPLILAGLLALCASARAENLIHTTTMATRSADALAPLTVPRFDHSLGFLDEVRIDVSLHVTGAVGYENVSSNHDVVTVNFGAGCALTAEGGATLVSLAQVIEASHVVEPFDGKVDFGGTSGRILAGLEVETSSSWEVVADPSWTTALAGNEGPIVLGLQLYDLTFVESSQQLVIRRGQLAEVEVTVTYTYTPWKVMED